MLYREIMAVYHQIRTKHINTLCGQNADILNIKPFGSYSDHWALNVSIICIVMSHNDATR